MKTDITIYHKILGLGQNPDTFKITHLKNVSWQGGDGASVNKGYEKANDIKLRIFKKDNIDVFETPFSSASEIIDLYLFSSFSKYSSFNIIIVP